MGWVRQARRRPRSRPSAPRAAPGDSSRSPAGKNGLSRGLVRTLPIRLAAKLRNVGTESNGTIKTVMFHLSDPSPKAMIFGVIRERSLDRAVKRDRIGPVSSSR
jgi:hypothetical protein